MSNLKVISPAENRLLVNLNKVKIELNIEEDEILYQLIERASRMIEDYTHRIFVKQGYQETLNNINKDKIILSQIPVISIETILMDEDILLSYDKFDAESGIVYLDNWWGSFYIMPVNKIIIEYTAGYEEIPGEIENACIELVKDMYANRNSSVRVDSERIGSYSVSYGSTSILDKLIPHWRKIF